MTHPTTPVYNPLTPKTKFNQVNAQKEKKLEMVPTKVY